MKSEVVICADQGVWGLAGDPLSVRGVGMGWVAPGEDLTLPTAIRRTTSIAAMVLRLTEESEMTAKRTARALANLDVLRRQHSDARPLRAGDVRRMVLDTMLCEYSEYREIPGIVRDFAFEVDRYLTSRPGTGAWLRLN